MSAARLIHEDELRAMREEVRHSPEAEHTVWWLLLCRKVEAHYNASYLQGFIDGRLSSQLALDTFDEHDVCDSFAGLPVEFFNPGPSFA